MKHLIFALMLTVSAGCKDTGVEPGPPDIPIEQLLAAPDTVQVDGKALVLSSYLWRDFMPSTTPDGHPLTGVLTVATVDSTQMPAALTADAAWLVCQGEVWKAWMSDSPSNDPRHLPYQMVKNVRNGPFWEVSATVTVVVRLYDAQGHAMLLRASGQRVGRTD